MLAGVYTFQNTTLLEIAYHGSTLFPPVKTFVIYSSSAYVLTNNMDHDQTGSSLTRVGSVCFNDNI